MHAVDHALIKKFRNDLIDAGRIKPYLRTSESVTLIRKQIIERHDRILTRDISRYVVGISDADVRRGIGRDVRDDIVIDLVVIGIELYADIDVRIQSLEVLYRLIIDICLIDIRIILRPERDIELTRCIERLGDRPISVLRSQTMGACPQVFRA